MKMRAALGDKWLRPSAVVAIAVVWIAGLCAQAIASNLYVPNEYIIRTTPGASLDTVKDSVRRMGGEIMTILPPENTYLIKVSSGMQKTYDGISKSGAKAAARWVIERIQPNLVYQKSAIPTDPYWEKMWDMVQINMPVAWSIEKGASDVVVAVTDTGVSKHPELMARLVPGYDFIEGDNDPNNDIDGHGTHVSGTIAAQGGNGIGICGVCWDNVKIMPVRVLDDQGSGSTAGIVQGLDWAISHGANVVNMSLGFPVPGTPDEEIHQALIRCQNAGLIVCASAGNSRGDLSAPAMYDECMAVGSTGPFEGIAPYSSFGPGFEVDIAAPGGDGSFGDAGWIWSCTVSWDDTNTVPTYGYAGQGWQGTSMACPHVSGAAALLLSNGVVPSEVRSRLTSTARTPKGGGMDRKKYGAGILNVQAALANAAIRISKPARGGTASSLPDFRIDIDGVTITSIKVYFDYSDLNDDGIPDDVNEAQIINGTNISNFLNEDQSAIVFNWSHPSLYLPQRTALTSGNHTIYVTGTAATGGAQVSDWEAFNVVGKVVSRGIHMFAFPHILTDRLTDTPASILPGAKFAAGQSPRSTLIRYIAAPRSAVDARPIGYETYVPVSASDRTWVNPFYTVGGLSVPLGGGYYYDVLTGLRTSSSPAGSGYWLILANDVAIDETYATLDADPNFDDSKGYEARAFKGWNMIGNPYGHSIPWRAALFTYKGQTKGLLDAESAGWVRSAMYGYGGTSVGYVRVSDRDMLEPFAGYWLLAQVGGTTDSDALVLRLLP